MLIDNKGREVRADKLPRGGKARDAALASVRELPVPAKHHGPMFSIGERARLVEARK